MRIEEIIPRPPRAQRISVYTLDETPRQNRDLWMLLGSLQGLVNRTEPHVYLRDAEGSLNADHWVEYYEAELGIPVSQAGGLEHLMSEHADAAEGYVLADESVPQTMNLAITRCGLEGLLPVAPAHEPLMERFGIPKKDDLTGRFSDDWEAAEWAVRNLFLGCHDRLYANLCVHRPHWSSMSHNLSDFVVANRILALDLPASRVIRKALLLYRELLENLDAPGAQFGWHCTFDQEKEYVAEAAERGVMTIASTSILNLSLHNAVGDPDASYEQRLTAVESVAADPDKVYVCFYQSDGDACSAVNSQQATNWRSEHRGEFSYGWGMLPLSAELMPGMLRYYHDTRKELDCFWGPCSGAAYTYSFLWPDDMVEWYLTESRRLIERTGHTGCNMVNWLLKDWWREVEDDDAIRREQRILGGPAIVCGLGGSPYAANYPDAEVPKVHSVHIANERQPTASDIEGLAEQIPTRPLFLFLFAQDSSGIYNHLAQELPKLADHAEIEVVSMDAFGLKLGDAVKRGLIGDDLYETTEAAAERWLKAPGRHRLPISELLTRELAQVASMESLERRRILADAAWTELVSREIESVARDRDRFLTRFQGRTIIPEECEADALLHAAFHVAWAVARAAVQSQGVYANERSATLAEFRERCGSFLDTAPFEKLFEAWDAWETAVPNIDEIAAWCRQMADETRVLREHFGPDESEDAFTNWPPRSI